MKNVADTHHLWKRGNVWYFRRKVPANLVDKAGTPVAQYSLETTDKREAQRRARVEDVKFDRWIADLEAGTTIPTTGKGSVSAPRKVSVDELVEFTRAYVETESDRRAKRLIADPPDDDEQRREMLADAVDERTAMQTPGYPERERYVGGLARDIAAKAGLGEERPAALFALAGRALVEIARRHEARLEGDYGTTSFDAMFAPGASDAKPSTTFGTLCDQFVAELREEHRLNDVASQRTRHVEAEVALLQEIIGPATVVATIDYDVVQKVRATLTRVPIGKTKRYPDLVLADAITRAEKDGARTLASPTQAAYLTTLRNILLRAVRQKLLSSNPAEDVKPIVKDNVPLHEKRHPFRLDQLRQFFTGTFYRSCAPDAPAPYAKKDRAWRYWVPLLMLFSGARPNEICQLFVEDVKVTEKGTPFLDLVNEDENQSRKTSTSRRRVPLHPELIKLGFLDFVAERRKGIAEHGVRLFHELQARPGDPTNFARYVGRRFNAVFLPQEITVEPRQAFYSIRHSVRDALRRIKASDEALLALGGWAPPGGKAVSANYGDIHNPDLWVDEIEGIEFPGLDLSFLHPAKT